MPQTVANRRPTPDTALFINRDLTAFALRDRLVRRPPRGDGPPAARPVPVTPDGRLAPHVLYPASDDANVRYALPRYEPRRVNNRHTTRLRLRAVDEDPDGPIGRLIVDLIADMPDHAGNPLRQIPHTATVALLYSLPVEGRSAVDPAQPESYAGEWANIDPNTRGLTRLVVGRDGAGQSTLHGFGRCQPEDCDWGVTTAQIEDDTLRGAYALPQRRRSLTLELRDELLRVTVFDDFTEASGQADRTRRYLLARVSAPPQARTPIREALGPLNRVAGDVYRVTVPIFSQALYDQYFQVLTDRSYDARLEITSRATVGQRSWRQWWVEPRPDLRFVHIRPDTVRQLRRAVIDGLRAPTAPTTPGTIQPVIDFTINTHTLSPTLLKPKPTVVQPTVKPIIGTLVTPAKPVTLNPAILTALGGLSRPQRVVMPSADALPSAAAAADAQPSAAAAPALTINNTNIATLIDAHRAPGLIDAITALRAQPATDPTVNAALTTLVDRAVITALPPRIAVDPQGQPVLVRREVETVQMIAPFWFDPAAGDHTFDGPLNPDQHSVLFRETVTVDGEAVTFFQNSLVREQVYYEPQSFRLARSDAPPFLPGLVFALNDIVTETEETRFEARCAFRALPYISPRFLLAARQQFGAAARFNALMPADARLLLRVPPAEGPIGPAQPREDALVSFDEGITDELVLDENQFVRLAAAFQAPDGVGLQGMVEATLSDGSAVEIDLNLSLRETVGALFDTQFTGPVDGAADQFGVVLRNRIESPVRIAQLLPVPLDADRVAQPLDLPPAAPVAPGDTIAVRYRVTPGGGMVLDIAPSLVADVLPDAPRLFGALTLTEAFTEESFSVVVAINPLFLAGAGLDGVRVEFRDGQSVTLTAATPSQSVTLKKPLLMRILNLETVYEYRVVRLAGGGEDAGPWQSHLGHLQVIL